eukprot:TRINITY_DN2419_c0_g1_i4.p1 TRINITY_DN2419_c0_g1~~TRINITY_DN2419_c0_g1_i4.p1  ORF type:complete len:654 (+),score=165.51 TRINITY_DN2419_c0_g1_i4:334-2295(+)
MLRRSVLLCAVLFLLTLVANHELHRFTGVSDDWLGRLDISAMGIELAQLKARNAELNKRLEEYRKGAEWAVEDIAARLEGGEPVGHTGQLSEALLMKKTREIANGRNQAFSPLGLLMNSYHLPPLRDQAAHPVSVCQDIIESQVKTTQVFRSAYLLNETIQSGADALYYSMPDMRPPRVSRSNDAVKEVKVDGNTSGWEIFSGLQDGMHVRLVPAHIGLVVNITTPMTLVNRKNIIVDFNNIPFTLNEAEGERYIFRIEHCKNVTIMNADFSFVNVPTPQFYQCQSDNRTGTMFVYKSPRVAIIRSSFHNSVLASIVLSHSPRAWVANNSVTNSGAGGIILHGLSYECVIENNRIVNSTGIANWYASIVLSFRQADLRLGIGYILSNHFHHDPAFSLMHRTEYPSRNIIARNYIGYSNAQGIYLDGVIGNVIIGNEIKHSSKEGLCLDGGSTSNIVLDNHIHHCGQRAKQEDYVLKQEVPDNRTGTDGLTIYKLPGISIDNGLYNIILRNNLRYNYGGGVKMVRTSFFNMVVDNVIYENNLGGSVYIAYPGVSMMNDVSDDHGTTDIDYAPSVGNIISHNTILGYHGLGVLIAPGSICNEIFLNDISDAKYFSIESLTEQLNFIDSSNPESNLRSPQNFLVEDNWPISRMPLM